MLTSPAFATEKPVCSVYGVCGGCCYQHVSYEEELTSKEASLRDILQNILKIEDSLFESIVPSPKPYHYRSRLDLTLRRRRGQFEMGFQVAGQHRLVPVESCPIAAEPISEFLPALKDEASKKLPENYGNANLVIRTGDDGRILWGGIGRRSCELQPSDYLWTEIHGKRVFYSLDTFFQANLSILPFLMDCIQELAALDSSTVFLDLYAGVGLFGIYFAELAGQVHMIEEGAASIDLMRFNIDYHKLTNVQTGAGKVEALLPVILSSLDSGRRKVAFIDPPRRGLSEETRNVLARAKELDALFYLSCQPESLVRDLTDFTRHQWKIKKVIPFDFFPRTQHLETLVLLKL